jgi:alkylation response protein AidB-like acyl-CoA dehydrogenase
VNVFRRMPFELALTIGEGTCDIQRLVIARHILGN